MDLHVNYVQMPKSKWELGEMWDSECNNMIHPSCGRKIAEMFEDGERQGPLFCSKRCFKQHKKPPASAEMRAKGRVGWSKDGPSLRSVLFPSWSIGWQPMTTTITGMEGTNTMDQQSQYSSIKQCSLCKKKASSSQGQAKMFITGLTALRNSLGQLEIGWAKQGLASLTRRVLGQLLLSIASRSYGWQTQ